MQITLTVTGEPSEVMGWLSQLAESTLGEASEVQEQSALDLSQLDLLGWTPERVQQLVDSIPEESPAMIALDVISRDAPQTPIAHVREMCEVDQKKFVGQMAALMRRIHYVLPREYPLVVHDHRNHVYRMDPKVAPLVQEAIARRLGTD